MAGAQAVVNLKALLFALRDASSDELSIWFA